MQPIWMRLTRSERWHIISVQPYWVPSLVLFPAQAHRHGTLPHNIYVFGWNLTFFFTSLSFSIERPTKKRISDLLLTLQTTMTPDLSMTENVLVALDRQEHKVGKLSVILIENLRHLSSKNCPWERLHPNQDFIVDWRKLEFVPWLLRRNHR